MSDQCEESHDRSVLDKVPIREESWKWPGISGSHVDILGVWDESDISLDIVGCLVMLGVRDAPGMVRDQEKGVDKQSDAIVDGFGLGEGAVTGFVGEFPEAGEDEPLTKSVSNPAEEAKGGCR